MPKEIAYRTLAAHLRSAIREGQFSDGRSLPTEQELAVTYGVSRHTVRRAMQDLVSEAIVYRRQGSGTYPTVTTGSYIRQVGSVEDLMALSEDTTCELISPLEHKVDVDSASRLRLASDGVMQLTLRRFHGGHPFCFTSVTLPPRIGADLKGIPEVSVPGTQSEVTIIGLINARAPKLITDAEQSVSATVGPDFAMKHLTCDIGSPALRIDRLYFDGAGDPVELAISYFVPSLYSYRIRLRRQPL